MIVMKFGGSSVGGPERIRTAADLVVDRLPLRPLVVMSAVGSSPGVQSGAGGAGRKLPGTDGRPRGKITDILIGATRKAVAGDPFSGFQEIQERHYEVLDGLELDRGLIEGELAELNELLRGIFLVKELTSRTLDYAMSFGERISAKILAAELARRGVNAAAVNSYDIGFLTDGRFGAARPLPDSPARIRDAVAARDEDLIVTTGFIGKNAGGEVTTVGRGGSDYTASYFAAALGAEEVQIWTDVDGVLTADPSLIKEAHSIERMTFREAAELAYYGAQVLHPATMTPAVEKGIPVRVLNTFRPEAGGTLIVPDTQGEEDELARVKSIVYKENITLINITSTRMLGQAGFMARLFDVFRRHEVVINMIATSEVSVSLTTDCTESAEAAAEELRTSEVAEVVVTGGRSIVCVVGGAMRHVIGTAARVFGTVAARGANIQMISQGANEINIAFLVDDADVPKVVGGLHREFFPEAY